MYNLDKILSASSQIVNKGGIWQFLAVCHLPGVQLFQFCKNAATVLLLGFVLSHCRSPLFELKFFSTSVSRLSKMWATFCTG